MSIATGPLARVTAYPKIPGPFRRDPATNLLTAEWSTPELEATAGLPWLFTEKVDGTNVRIVWDGYRVSFAGRTDNAQLPAPLWAWLQERFGGPEREQLFEQKFGATPAVLYGEGYGPKIQNGGKYRENVAVVLFDVRVDDWWLLRDDVYDVAGYFEVGVVPVAFEGTLVEAVGRMRRDELESAWGPVPAEGVVGTTAAGLLARSSERIVVKLKGRDLLGTR